MSGFRQRTFSDLAGPAENTYSGWYQFVHPIFGTDPRQDYVGTAPRGGTFSETIVDDMTWKRVNHHYINGGPFHLRRLIEKSERMPLGGSGSGYPNWSISGYTYPQFWGMPLNLEPLEIPESGESDCASYGAEAWNKFKPGKPDASLGVFLAELRDLPSMLRSRSYQHLNAGSHYLSYEFGWKPFVKDLMKMFKLYNELDSKLDALIALDGRPVRKKGTVRNIRQPGASWAGDNGYYIVFSPMPHFTAEMSNSYGYTGFEEVGERVWFTATFSFYIPNLPRILTDKKQRMRMKAKMLGLSLTPANVWAAMPWTWLIDYFGNVGHVLSNMASGSLGDVASANAYVMRHAWRKFRQESWCSLKDGSYHKGVIERTAETKDRMKADPFGFGLSTTLSGRQAAILAALGISRM